MNSHSSFGIRHSSFSSLFVVEFRFELGVVVFFFVRVIGRELVGVAGQLFVPLFFEVVVEIVVEIVVVEIVERIGGAQQAVVERLAQLASFVRFVLFGTCRL